MHRRPGTRHALTYTGMPSGALLRSFAVGLVIGGIGSATAGFALGLGGAVRRAFGEATDSLILVPGIMLSLAAGAFLAHALEADGAWPGRARVGSRRRP